MNTSSLRDPIDLVPEYTSRHFNALSPTDLLHDEVVQRPETWFEVDDIVREAKRTEQTRPTGRRFLALLTRWSTQHVDPGGNMSCPTTSR